MITIDIATEADLNELLALLERSELPTVGLAEHLHTALIARDADQIVGSTALELYGAYALLRSVAVDRRWRGHGLGQRLVDATLDLAQQQDVTNVYLLTETAADFFPRFGFMPVDRATVALPIQQSIEWTNACPSSAQAMHLIFR